MINDLTSYWATVDENWEYILRILGDNLDLSRPAYNIPGETSSGYVSRDTRVTIPCFEEIEYLRKNRDRKLLRYFNAAWFICPESYCWNVPKWGIFCDLCSEEWVFDEVEQNVNSMENTDNTIIEINSETLIKEEPLNDFLFQEKFKHFLVKTKQEYSKHPLTILSDRGIENRLLDNLVEFLPNGAVIAGGFMQAVISEEKNATDIDFFFTSEKAFRDTMNLFLNPPEEAWSYKGYKLKDENDLKNIKNLRYLSLVHDTRPAVQLLKMVWYDDAAHVIDSFDFTCVQFAVDNQGFYCNAMSIMDLASKRLVLHRIQFPSSTLRRLVKYSKKGFYACPGSLIKITEEIQKFTGQDDNNEVVYVD